MERADAAGATTQDSGALWRAPTGGARWPVPEGEDVVFFSEVVAPTERVILDRWIAEHRPPGTTAAQVRVVHLDRVRSDADLRAQEGRIAGLLDAPGDPWFVPLRVAWVPPDGDAAGSVRLRDVALIGDPRRPRAWVQPWLARNPARTKVLDGGAARQSWLERRWKRHTGAGRNGTSFPNFLILQGVLSMERAEAELQGAQYKVPRMVREDLASGTRFQAGLSALASELGRPFEEVRAEAFGYLDEMVTGYGRLLVDLGARLGRAVYRLGYDASLDYDDSQIARARHALGEHPAVILPTHKSMIDTMVMPAAFSELGFPRNHTLGGINLAFWPIGPLMRRSGVIFIRRRIKDNPVYRYTLREYIGYLVEKRFNLEWYIEGGRTRTGKLLPPRLGLLAYVADAFWQGRTEDVMLLPVAVAYDQLHEVSAFAHEARGGSKQKENLGWMINYIRAQRSNFGRIYVRFGEPVSMRAMLGPPPVVSGGAGRPDRLALQKMAFEVAVRINQVTPITASALVAFALLSAGENALTLDQVVATLAAPLEFVARRELPMAESARRCATPAGVQAALGELRRHHVVEAYDDGHEPVFRIEPGGHHAAAFYRNSILHFFLTSSIGELAVLRAGAEEDMPLVAFWDEAAHLRDLLKFDFFFAEKAAFNETLRVEMARHDPAWEEEIASGGTASRGVLGAFQPLSSHMVLRPFLEAYLVVADVLVEWGTHTPFDEKRALARCHQVGRQYLLQGRLHRPEAVSQLLFGTGIQLAANRRLTQPNGTDVPADLPEARRAFANELLVLTRALDVVETLAATERDQRVGVVPVPAVLDAYVADIRSPLTPAPSPLSPR